MVRLKNLAFCVGALTVLAGCGQEEQETQSQVRTVRDALTASAEALRILGFEDAADWNGSSANSSESSQGASSVGVSVNGWTEITSVPLSTLGTVAPLLSVDVQLPAATPYWGEVRVIVKLPSQGESYRDLGGASLTALTPGTFHTLEFPVPTDLRTKFAEQYTDLSFSVIINAPAGDYLVDNLSIGQDLEGGQSDSSASTSQLQLLSFSLPMGASPADIAVASQFGLELKDRVHIESSGDSLISSAEGAVDIGVEAEIDSVVSGDDVELRDRAVATGAVLAAGDVIKHNDVSIQGEETAGANVLPFDTFSWRARLPAISTEDYHLEPVSDLALSPGSYGALVVKPGTSIHLSSGEYTFNSIEVHSEGKLVIDDHQAPVVVYVRDTFSFKGSIQGVFRAVPQLLLVDLGVTTVFVESSFVGTLVVPNATLRLQAALPNGHTGTFVAKEFHAEPDTIIHHRSFPWHLLDTPTSEPLPVLVPHLLPESPVNLTATTEGGATSEQEEPVSFEVPDELRVSKGNAGMGTATLTFVTPSGTTVTCTYQGGATVPHPDNFLEFAKGLTYNFVSCSNGSVPGDTNQGTSFTLDVTGDDDSVLGPEVGVQVELALGGGCSGTLEQPITPLESRQLVEGFDWADTESVAETNDDGTPALYYANIYVRTDEELALLDTFFIHYQSKPLLTTEMAKYDGQCGTIQYEGDGEGIFVFAVIPGATYNRLREATTRSDIPADERVVFRAIVLRDVPAAMKNANGSLNYNALVAGGFYYRDQRTVTPGTAGAVTQGGGGGGKSWLSVVEFVVSVAEEAGSLATQALGAFDRWLNGRVTVHVDLNIMNRDPFFPSNTALQTGWGSRAGEELSVPGVEVEILQWAQHLNTLGVPLPTKFVGKVNANGRTDIDVTRNGTELLGLGGVTTRGTDGLCVRAENDAAMLASLFTANETCNFSKNDELDGDFNNFESDSNVDINTGNFDLHGLAQMTDVWQYARDVLNYRMRRARILTGYSAAVLSPDAGNEVDNEHGEQRLWAPCQGFPNAATDVAAWVGGLIPGVNILVHQMDTADIIMARNSRAKRSRGVLSHEYGHFLFCHLMAETRDLSLFTLETMWEGPTIQEKDDTRYINEAFADFIMGQVVGGKDYNWSAGDGGTAIQYDPDEDNPSFGSYEDYCISQERRGLLSGFRCFERNNAFSAEGIDSVGRLATLFHDFFDGATPGPRNPTNGDAFDLAPTSAPECAHHRNPVLNDPRDFQCLIHSQAYGDLMDERVSIPGPGLVDWITRDMLEFEGSNLKAPNESSLLKGLNKTARSSGASWCDTCQAFALHRVAPELEWPFETCGNRDVDISLDPDHCGACGTSCAAGEVCSAGSCQPSCGAGLTQCDRSCADLSTHPSHCGACNQGCIAGQQCINGTCTGYPSYVKELWQACVENELVSDIVGPPPVESLRMDAASCAECPPGQVSNDSGTCEDCPNGEVVEGNECQTCPETSIIDTLGRCCAVDANVDYDVVLAPSCPQSFGNVITDSCGNTVVAEFDNLDVLVENGESGLLKFGLIASGAESCEGTHQLTVYAEDSPGSWVAIGNTTFSGGQFDPPFCTFPVDATVYVGTDAIINGITKLRVVSLKIDGSTAASISLSTDFGICDPT